MSDAATSARFSFPKEQIKILLLENIHPSARKVFEKDGYSVETLTGALSEDELLERIGQVSILGIRSNTTLTPKVLEHAKRLLAVGAFCIGTNQVDIAMAAKHGVAVFNAPYSNTRSVVELAIAEIISLSRRLTGKNAAMHKGVWDKSATGSHEIRGKMLGIIGYGNIGSQLSVVAESLGMQVQYFDIADKLSLGNARQRKTLYELLESSDFVSLHVDGRPGNGGIFGEKELASMKPGAALLNLSRGMVVDVTALRSHLDSGHISGAAIDVFPAEPKMTGDSFVSDLQGLPNVILTPHVGGSTEEAQDSIGQFVAHKLLNFVNNGSTSLSVNMPTLNMPKRDESHRLVLLHQNVPGVLAHINTLLAKEGVNIIGQSLGTRDDIGYAITDIDTGYAQDVIKQLRSLPETIRLRVLY